VDTEIEFALIFIAGYDIIICFVILFYLYLEMYYVPEYL